MITITYFEFIAICLSAILWSVITMTVVKHYEDLIKKKTDEAYEKGYLRGLHQKVVKASEQAE